VVKIALATGLSHPRFLPTEWRVSVVGKTRFSSLEHYRYASKSSGKIGANPQPV
jgi:hypothetical protein